MSAVDDATILTNSQTVAQPVQYGRYRIVSELGRGGMGVVYKAHDPQIDRIIALKVLREDRVTSGEFVRRFLKEAMAVGRLSHPGIVTVYDVGQDHGTVYIAMEFLQGKPLDELMESRQFTLSEIVSIGIQTAQALQYAHRHGIIHRDIKPPNLLYSPEGTIRVTDFGIARIEDPSGGTMTQVGEILGTPRFMSPEQLMGQELDGRSDLYSLGVILYQLTTGKRPFQGETLAAIFRSITQDTPESPHVLEPMLPEALSATIMRLLEKNPADRFADGDQLVAALKKCLPAAKPAPAAGSPPPPPQSQPRPRGNQLIGLVAGLFCLALVGGGYYYFQHATQPTRLADTIAPPTESRTPNSPPSQAEQPPTGPVGKTESRPEVPQPPTTDQVGQHGSVGQAPGPDASAGPPAGRTTAPAQPQIDPSELIRQATTLSAIISELPKKELVLKSAQELAKVSPRYQEDLTVAENTYNNARAQREKRVDSYLHEIQTMSRTFTSEQITNALELMNKESLSARQRAALELAKDHLKSLKNDARLSSETVLNDFLQHFENFTD